jgi:hypothetical protein
MGSLCINCVGTHIFGDRPSFHSLLLRFLLDQDGHNWLQYCEIVYFNQPECEAPFGYLDSLAYDNVYNVYFYSLIVANPAEWCCQLHPPLRPWLPRTGLTTIGLLPGWAPSLELGHVYHAQRGSTNAHELVHFHAAAKLHNMRVGKSRCWYTRRQTCITGWSDIASHIPLPKFTSCTIPEALGFVSIVDDMLIFMQTDHKLGFFMHVIFFIVVEPTCMDFLVSVLVHNGKCLLDAHSDY